MTVTMDACFNGAGRITQIIFHFSSSLNEMKECQNECMYKANALMSGHKSRTVVTLRFIKLSVCAIVV